MIAPAKYDNDYHYHLQAVIYDMLRMGGFSHVHNMMGYKFFCFSNIFPPRDFTIGDVRHFLISSPNPAVVEALWKVCNSMMIYATPLMAGAMRFSITAVSRPFQPRITEQCVSVHSTTPIVIRIPRGRCAAYGIKPAVDYDYVFWRGAMPVDALINQVRDGIAKKWKEYFNDMDTQNLIASNDPADDFVPQIIGCELLRTIAKPIHVGNSEQLIVGSYWNLTFEILSPAHKKTLEFALDCGLGERNPLGFGFMDFREQTTQYQV